MDPLLTVIFALAGYLIGSISFARIITRLVAPQQAVPEKTEVGLEGSDKKMVLGTVSASSVSVHVGSRYGFMTYVLDLLKIFIPAIVLKLLFPGTYYFLVAAVAGTVGHVWPVYHKFRGGRGLSAVYGGLLAIDWIGVFATSIGGMLFGLLVVRDVLTAYLAGVWLIIPWLWFRTHDSAYLVYAVVVNIICMIAMIPEIKQWMKIRREDKWNDPAEVIQLSGMGRGLLKMAKKLGILKKKPDREAEKG